MNELLNKIFNLSDTDLEEAKRLSDEVQFYGYKVKDFNEEQLRIAIGVMAKMINYEQERLLKLVRFTDLTLITSNFNITI